MKQSFLLLFHLLLIGQLVNAQKSLKKSLTGISRVEFKTETNVSIITGSTNEIIISEGCTGCGSDSEPVVKEENQKTEDERAKGLKPIFPEGVDNTGMGILIQQEGETLNIKDLKARTMRRGFTITLPSSMALKLDCGDIGNAIIEVRTSDLEISTGGGAITLKKVTGPVTAHSFTGNIEVDFSTVSQQAPTSIISSSGFIDVSLPANVKTSVELKSSTGTVYSGFDITKRREDKLKPLNGNSMITGDINNGGAKISLRSSTGNIYLRKK